MAETRTKIVATLGPALDAPGVLERTIAAGVDVLRVNLSHGPPASHRARVERARATDPGLAVLADLCGPKLRIGELASPVLLRDGDRVVLSTSGRGIPVDDPEFPGRVRAGDPVWLADGTLKLEAVKVQGGDVECVVAVGGTLTSRKGINLPGDHSDVPPLTAKDRRDLAELGEISPDFVALSYVRRPEDLEGLPRPVIAKVEKSDAVERMEAIVAAFDGVMVARGDLGIETPIERVPMVQKRLIAMANRAGKPVITATQMLLSMVSRPVPTRAEASDVANAVLDGTDAVMLSEETAAGRDPVAVVETMERIIREAEAHRAAQPDLPTPSATESAVARAAVRLALDVGAAGLVIPTASGATARRVAAFRPPVPVVAICPDAATARRLRLTWGVTPVQAAETPDPLGRALYQARKRFPAGSRVVVTAGWPPGRAGDTSLIHLATV